MENAFGILSHRWQIFQKPILLAPNRACHLVLASLVLHNLLRSKQEDTVYTSPGLLDSERANGELVHGIWRNNAGAVEAFIPAEPVALRPTLAAEGIRDELRTYFNGNGAVPWQWKRIYE